MTCVNLLLSVTGSVTVERVRGRQMLRHKRLLMQSKEHGFYSNYNGNTLKRFTFLKYTSCYVDKNHRQ